MTASMKSALLLSAALMLGVFLGITGAGALQRQRFGPPPAERGGPRGLERHMEETIHPRDSVQAQQIRPILARAAARNRQIIAGLNGALHASIDSMKLELALILDDAQRARVDEVTQRLPPVGGPGGPPGRFGPPGRGRRGGPPFGPPPERPD